MNNTDFNEENNLSSSTYHTETEKKLFDNIGYILLMALFFSILFCFCFHDFYVNFIGIVYPIFAFGLWGITLLLRKKLKHNNTNKNVYLYGSLSILFSISTFLTANLFICFFNTVAIFILFTVFMLNEFYSLQNWSTKKKVYAMIKIWLQTLPALMTPFFQIRAYFKEKLKNYKKVRDIVLGILISVPFLAFILLLLGKADLIFGTILETIFFDFLFSADFITYIYMIAFGFLAFLGFIYSLALENLDSYEIETQKSDSLIPIVMASLVSFCYVAFCIIQIVYLFGGGLLTLPFHMTYAEYARQGFFQLLFVTCINLVFVLFFQYRFEITSKLRILLSIISTCTLIMIASAAYRMLLYVSAYHLSFLRILVLWFLVMLTFIILVVLFSLHFPNIKVYRNIFWISCFFFLLFSFGRPDYWVAKYNVTYMDTLTTMDVYYMTHHLSQDAAPALVHIPSEKLESADLVTRYFRDIKDDYVSNPRFFHYSKYQAYKTANQYLNP